MLYGGLDPWGLQVDATQAQAEQLERMGVEPLETIELGPVDGEVPQVSDDDPTYIVEIAGDLTLNPNSWKCTLQGQVTITLRTRLIRIYRHPTLASLDMQIDQARNARMESSRRVEELFNQLVRTPEDSIDRGVIQSHIEDEIEEGNNLTRQILDLRTERRDAESRIPEEQEIVRVETTEDIEQFTYVFQCVDFTTENGWGRMIAHYLRTIGAGHHDRPDDIPKTEVGEDPPPPGTPASELPGVPPRLEPPPDPDLLLPGDPIPDDAQLGQYFLHRMLEMHDYNKDSRVMPL